MTNEEELAKIIFFSRNIESILKDKFKAKGKGLHTYIDSIENKLDPLLLKDLRYIATIRNKSMHESLFKIDNYNSNYIDGQYQKLNNKIPIEVKEEQKKSSNFIIISDKKDITSDNMVATKECLAFNNMKHTKNKNNISLKKGYRYKIIKHQKNQVRIFIDYISHREVPNRWVDSNCFE